MSTVISLDDAVVQLSEMFPSFDTDVLRMVITENGTRFDKYEFYSFRRQHGESYCVTFDHVWR